MSTKSNQLGKQAKEVTEDLEKMGKTVRNSAQAKLGQVGDKASEYYEEGRDRVHGVASTCEQFLYERPLTCAFIAGCVGWLLGRFWKRR